MKKFLLTLFLLIVTSSGAFATKLPDDIQAYIRRDFKQADFRFDGVIILEDGTLYLPLLPAYMSKVESVNVSKTYPGNRRLVDKPDVVVFNNNYVLLKVITDVDGRRTIARMAKPFPEVTTGLLPQDMLVPKNLSIPDNIKGIIGNLKISTFKHDLKIKADDNSNYVSATHKKYVNLVESVPALKNKTLYVASSYSKNIQVVEGEAKEPSYALAQKTVPFDVKISPDGKFLIVAAYEHKMLDIISLADERIIKQVELNSQPAEIMIHGNSAYVSAPDESSIYVLDLETMTLTKKIKVNGMCEKLTYADGIMFYYDKKSSSVWAIEVENNYLLKEVGKISNVSKILYAYGKVYITSRTKNVISIVDYDTLTIADVFPTADKPVDMIAFGDKVYVLCASENLIEIIDSEKDIKIDSIALQSEGFPTKMYIVKDSNLAVVTDSRSGSYSVLNLDTNKLIKTTPLYIPVSSMVITNRVKKIN